MSKSRKGSEFERQISKFLSSWLTGSERPLQFWRSPSSGGLSTRYQDDNISGDIVAITKESKSMWPFSVECKNGYGKINITHNFIQDSKSNNIKDFWIQCTDDCPADKYPMLIFKQLRHKPLVGIDHRAYEKLKFKLSTLNICYLYFGIESLPILVLMDFKEFFECITQDDIKKLKADE